MRKSTNLRHETKIAANGSYDSSRVTIDTIVVHTMVGTLDGTAAWFSNAGRSKLSSAHYGVGFDGRIQLYVEEDKTAYHAGNYPMNQRSIGIEFEDKGKPNDPRPELLYQTGAKLIADIARHYNITLDRSHVVKHKEVSQSSTACPGTLDIEKLINEAKNILGLGDPIKDYQMTESVFVGMVTKSRNFDDIADYLKLSQEARLDPKAGEKVVNEIKTIQSESKKLIEQSNKLLDQFESKSDQPEVGDSVLEKILPPKEPETLSTEDNPLLFDTKEELATIERGKKLLYEDISKLWNSLISWFWT